MPRKKKEEKTEQPVRESGLFIPLSETELEKLRKLSERDHNCPVELHVKKILSQYLANNIFYFTR